MVLLGGFVVLLVIVYGGLVFVFAVVIGGVAVATKDSKQKI